MRILIVEDEPQTAFMLKAIILKLRSETEIVEITDSVESTVSFLQHSVIFPELIFMDIQLADGISFSIFDKIQVKCPVIFCTAYDDYVLQAFKTSGIDYLLKPVREEDVNAAFRKFDTLKSSFDTTAFTNLIRNTVNTPQPTFKKTLLVQYRESIIPLQINNIAVFFVENEVLYAYTFDQQKFAIFRPLGEIENELNPAVFFRINRQALVNKLAIKEIQPYFNRKLSIHLSVKLPESLVVSRLKVSEFMKWMEE
jgi:DNA-binding LytR/AlgR family response regulator